MFPSVRKHKCVKSKGPWWQAVLVSHWVGGQPEIARRCDHHHRSAGEAHKCAKQMLADHKAA